MGVGDTLRGVAPVLGIVAGMGAVGAGIGYGTTRYAGDSDGGNAATIVSALNRPMLTGGLTGVVAAMVVPRTPLGRHLGSLGGLLMVPAGIGGAMLGGAIARAGLERRYPEEYQASEQAMDDAVEATRTMFRDAGAADDVLEQVPRRYDRSHMNASYAPPIGPFGHDVRVGRSPYGGQPLATDDVVAHEYAHMVIHQYAPRLMFSPGGDARAIHESLADTFAAAVDVDDWLLAEDAVPGGMRSMATPELLGARKEGVPQPAPITREQLGRSTEEHLGAGVGNKVAWRIGEALGRPELARIYVAALERRELGMNAGYDDLARGVRAAAVELHGAGSHEAAVVDDAWIRAGY